MPACETTLTLYWLYAPISYEPCLVCSCVFLVPANHDRTKHWILTGCHPPLLLFSEGSRLPNPWACLTIPLPPCRTPTLLFWSQGILEEKSLLTSNCYHLSLLLSFLEKKNNKPERQSAACVALRWISKWCLFRWGSGGGAHRDSCSVGCRRANVRPRTNAYCSS